MSSTDVVTEIINRFDTGTDATILALQNLGLVGSVWADIVPHELTSSSSVQYPYAVVTETGSNWYGEVKGQTSRVTERFVDIDVASNDRGQVANILDAFEAAYIGVGYPLFAGHLATYFFGRNITFLFPRAYLGKLSLRLLVETIVS